MTSAVVVGSGPNGLAGALTLARAGLEVTVLEAAATIGGGMRSAELTGGGLIHDVCSAFHPLAAGSAYMGGLGLEDHGLRWRWAETELAHPLDGGRGATLQRSLADTAADLGGDATRWRRLYGPLVAQLDDLFADIMAPVLHVPRHPVALARFGPLALLPATTVARAFRTEEARGLWAGIAAHSAQPLRCPTTAAIALVLGAAGHRWGWPVAEGGSQSIADAMGAALAALGGRIETGVRVVSVDQLPPADVTLLDLAPAGVADLLGDRLPPGVRRSYRRYRHGPAAWKVDLAVEGGVPWAYGPARRAGTVHVGGTAGEVAEAEAAVAAGRMPARPFVLVGQQSLADPTRAVGDVAPVWAYCHVPGGFDGDATEAVLAQLERFAPGVRDRIVGRHVTTPADWQAYNANYRGGDILTGANTPPQVLFRPRFSSQPYSCGVPGVWICSAATPPGGGVHGMCGHNAAAAALASLGR